MKFITKRCLSKAYDAKTLAKYEYKVTTKVIEGDLVDFVAGDEDARHDWVPTTRFQSAERQPVTKPTTITGEPTTVGRVRVTAGDCTASPHLTG